MGLSHELADEDIGNTQCVHPVTDHWPYANLVCRSHDYEEMICSGREDTLSHLGLAAGGMFGQGRHWSITQASVIQCDQFE